MHKTGIAGLILAGGLLLGSGSVTIAAEKASGPQALAKLIEGARKEGGFTLYHSPTNTDINMFLEAFTRKYDPYHDIPLNESLPQPVIELPIPGEAKEDDGDFRLKDRPKRTKDRKRNG